WGSINSAFGDAAEIVVATDPTKHWSPTTDYFRLVAETPNTGRAMTEVFDVSNLGGMIGALLTDIRGKKRPPKSVARLNIVGHGGGSKFGLHGNVDADGNVSFDPAILPDPSNPETALASPTFDDSSLRFLNDQGNNLRDDVRRVFRDDADIVLLLCNSG